MAASLTTNLRAQLYDGRREQEECHPDELSLYVITPQLGNNTPRKIRSGWYIKKEDDREEGAQFWVVRIAMTDVNLETLDTVFMTKVSSLSFNGLYYRIKASVLPTGDPSIWIIKAHPTGEKKL